MTAERISWNSEMDDYITANRGAKSAAVMGLHLNVTRNAVIGRSHRLGLEKLARTPAASKEVRAYKRSVARKSLVRVAPTMAGLPPPMPIEPLNIPFLDLTSRHCREIVGSEGIGQSLSCGHPVSSGSYCRWHGSINYTKPAPRTTTYHWGNPTA